MTMTLEEARGFAAQAWVHDRNVRTVMDVDIAESFAEILMNKVNESLRSEQIVNARKVFRDAFERDPDFRNVYVANVAMLLHDRYGIIDYNIRNRAASDILKLLFNI